MKKSTKIVLGIVTAVVIIAGIVIAVHPEIIGLPSGQAAENAPPAPQGGVNLNKSDFEIFSMLEVLFNKSLPYAQILPYISALHMEVYGRDDMNAQQLLQWFEADYAMDGWTPHGVYPQYASDWVGYHEAWTRGADARSVSIGEGAAVLSAFGHETVYIVAHGVATTYWQFWNLVR
jgi:hypothetical protein